MAMSPMTQRTGRLEWISLVYLVFFVLAVLSPSIYRQGYFGLTETRLEEITIFIFGLAGLMTFTGYERLMERREKEREQAQNDYQKAKTELIASYAYIGSINRKIELLKKLANDTSMRLVDQKKLPKELFHALVANARAAAGSEAALIRFVELEKLRTEREFAHHAEAKMSYRIANRDLREMHTQGKPFATLQSEDKRDILVVPSDRSEGVFKAFLLIPVTPEQAAFIDASLLKVFVNQAELLYASFINQPVQIEAPKQLVQAQ